MTNLTLALLGLALLVAVGDWFGVATGRDRWVYVCKPAVMAVLIAATLTLPDLPTPLRVLVIGGQLAGLAGDVALMLGKFLPGAGAFGVGHVLYILAWLPYTRPGVGAAVGVVAMLVVMATAGRAVTLATAQRSLTMSRVVAFYQVLLAVMVVAACATEVWLLAGAAALFAASDTLLGWTRFVHEAPRARVVVHVTYHLAQIGIVAALPLLTVP